MKDYLDIPDLTEEQFRRFTELIHREAFITLKDAKLTLLSNRLRKRLRALSLRDFESYYRFLQSKTTEAANEMVHFLEAVTTNESYFWRTTHNFDMLREYILPGLLQQFKGETLRFWSAGCSTGEEAYNLAIELTESMKHYGVFDFDIVGTDISNRVVEFAKIGKYSGRKIDRVPEMILSRYFREVKDEPGTVKIREDIKKRVVFKVDNIFHAKPGPFHMIFCRNVMIYFSRPDQELLANHFYSQLKNGGYLIVGHSESLHMMKTPFKSVHRDQGVAYHKNEKKHGWSDA